MGSVTSIWDTITIYLSNQTVSGTQDDLAGTCNTTGLSRKEVVLTGTCTSSPILAWIGAYATYSPWIEYKEIESCDNNDVTVCGDNQNFICGNKDNVTVIYEIKNQDMLSTNTTGECGIVQINGNQTIFSSMKCSNNAEILCSGNETLKAYPKYTNWVRTVKFCRTQDEVITSKENAMNRSLANITDGTYWVAAIRGISFRTLPAFDNDCVASIIENGKTMIPLVESCDVKLPVTCRAGSADRLGYGTSTEKGDTTTTMENVSGNPQHSNHDRKDSNTHVYNTTQGNDVDDLNPTRKEKHVHTTTQDKDYDDVDPKKMEMRVYTTTHDKDYDDVDPNRKEMRVYTTTQDKDYDDVDPNRMEMRVYTTTQAKDYDDLDPNRKEMHVYTTTHEKDYDDLDPNRKEMHVYTTTQGIDYDDLDTNRKEMHVYTTTHDKDYDDLDPNRKEMHVYTTTHKKIMTI
ncbi:unnamed protein product [Mytilus edulis]|uniref:Uncharacterized protein n=1 Tax=Mytilus edulis TaxID=6550 RepID=A0A8S3QVR9_MYTED|nr:unnamed protein product [Mytilus edulis]